MFEELKESRLLDIQSREQWHEMGGQGPDHARPYRLKEGDPFSFQVWHGLIAYLRDLSDCSLENGLDRGKSGTDIISNCTGKGRTMETVKTSVASRG